MSKLKIYTKSILIPILIGIIIGILISGSMNYESLVKPPLAPPAFLFPIVWAILYTLMGISDGILTANSLKDAKTNFIYYLQLFVNALWPIAFFLLKWRFFAFLWIILLAVLIIWMIREFYKKNKLSAYLQIPYLLWTLFATYLNLGIWWLNR
ncbi:MAG: tryptophan-rich sensory protein [Clostridia bacterium]|nr:tryptophan-rich sensory protein [Clostridia bacterium]